MPNRLQQLHAAGQSIWLDYIDRTMLHDGDLERRIREDALTGMTSNPTIFEKAFAEGHAYEAQLQAADAGLSAWELFELVETEDVRRACDLFLPVYEATKGKDGFVSIEVSPGVANDPDATIEEGRRLWKTVARPNLLVKVPGTESGARAVRQLLTDGINVNITLLFSIEAHHRVIDAYLDAVDRLSRGDSEVDKRLDTILAQLPEDRKAYVSTLKGKAAIANAKLAYRLFQQMFSGPRWDALAARGAHVQRPLWASTSTKNPAYRDVLYVEQLIGPDTINTMPPATLEAFRDHGETARTVDADVDAAERTLADLEALGISMRDVTDKLLVEGIASFQKSFDGLLAVLSRKLEALGAGAAR